MLLLLLLQVASPEGSGDALPRLLGPVPGGCTEGGACPGKGARRFRLQSAPAPQVDDAKQRAMRGVWQPCGITGAPVCPSKGQVIFRIDLGRG